MSAILVSHPHATAVSHGLAACLARSGKLAAFMTGVAACEGTRAGRLFARLARRRPVLRNRIMPEVLRGRLVALPHVELAARAAEWGVKALALPARGYDLIYMAHDAAVAAHRWPRETTMVYAYEDGALWTFRRAARAGIARAWDLPTPHYLTVEEVFREEARRWPDAFDAPAHSEPDWKRRRKDGELELATRLVVASAFTKRSLERLEITQPVAVVPYGFPVELFAARTQRPSGKFTVLSVGNHDVRKGTTYLLEAWKRAAIPDAELHLVGSLRLAKPFLDRHAGTFKHWGPVPRAQLGARYAAADLVAFPTLGDGFGLVIQEAMCSGTPVVTTPCGGGPECITDGVDGWVIPPRDLDAFVERLRACARDRDRLYAVGQAARARAERWTWNDADEALVRALD